jgi:dolichol-phosphate mannosyltransferase
VWAAIIAAEVTIIGNFLLQEHFVFQDMREDASGVWSRFAKSFGFNNAEAAIRIPIMAAMVASWHISAVIATAITLVVAFVVRFLFHSLVVYAPRRVGARSAARELMDEIDSQAMSPGEL